MLKRRAGFSFAELMVAILFISIGLFGYVSIQGYILKHSPKFKDREKAYKAAITTMNAIIYNLDDDYSGDYKRDLPPFLPEELPQNTKSINAVVQDIPGDIAVGDNADIKQVVVVISWEDKTGQQSFRLDEYYERYDYEK